MSGDLRDLFKKELDQIPLRPTETWVPQERTAQRTGVSWRLPLSVAAGLRLGRLLVVPLVAAVIVLAAVLGAGLRTVREQSPASQPEAPAVPVVLPTGSPSPQIEPNPGGTVWQQLRRALPAGVPVIEPTWLPPALADAGIDREVLGGLDPTRTTYTVIFHRSRGHESVTFALRPVVPTTPPPVGASGIGMTVRRSPATLIFPSDLFGHPGGEGLRVLSWTEGAYTLSISSETISGDDLLRIAWSLDQTGAPGAAPSARRKPGACADAASPEATVRHLIALLGSRDRDAATDCFASEAASSGAGWSTLPAATLDSIRPIDGAGGRTQLQVTWTFASDPGGAWNPRPTRFFLIGLEDGLLRVFDLTTFPFPKAP